MALITLQDYAQKHGKRNDVMTYRARTGGFKTAYKIGNIWVIDSEEPLTPRKPGPKPKQGADDK